MKLLTPLLLFLSVSAHAGFMTYTGSGGAIPDNCHPFCTGELEGAASEERFSDTLFVADSFIITDAYLLVDWTHSLHSDIVEFRLAHAPLSIHYNAPPNGPNRLAASSFIGQQAQGNWTLSIWDGFLHDTGHVNSWGVELHYEDAVAVPTPASGELMLSALLGLGVLVGHRRQWKS